MHYTVDSLLTTIGQRPAFPKDGATKGELLEFGPRYVAWLKVLDDVAATVKAAGEREAAEAERNKPTNYRTDARDDAAEMADNFIDEIVEQLADKGEASDDYNNDYPGGDSYHHETHVDRSYNVKESIELLDQLSDYEETDSGLWEGQEPEEVFGTKAAYTYGAAVSSFFGSLIEEINSAYDDSSAVLDVNDAYEDVEEAKALLAKLEAGEVAETDDDCQRQKAIVLAVIAGKDGDDARKEQIKKLVEETIAANKG
jgi:hypothetical protein